MLNFAHIKGNLLLGEKGRFVGRRTLRIHIAEPGWVVTMPDPLSVIDHGF